jgi:hypothetical protein
MYCIGTVLDLKIYYVGTMMDLLLGTSPFKKMDRVVPGRCDVHKFKNKLKRPNRANNLYDYVIKIKICR